MTFEQALATTSQEFQEQVQRRQKQNWLFGFDKNQSPKTKKPIIKWTAEKMFNFAEKVCLCESNLEDLLIAIADEEAFYTETPETPETIEESETPKESETDKNKPTERKKIARTCRVDLTDGEVQKRGQTLIKTMDDKDAESAEFEAVRDIHKSEQKKFESFIRELRHAIAQKYEYRKTACDEIFDFLIGIVRVERCDTGEVIDSRTMTDKERQRDLFDKTNPTEFPSSGD
jgi:hypothetical protein